MMHSYQIRVTDSDGTVVDTGWVTLKETPVDSAGIPLVGSVLYDEIIERGRDHGIFDTRQASERNPA